MKTTTLLASILLITTIFSSPVYAGIRCENDIISLGDTSSEVMLKLNKCGEVLNKEVVSKETISNSAEKEIGEKVKTEKVTENWHIRVKERGGIYCYPLSFEEGRLQGIGNWSSCD